MRIVALDEAAVRLGLEPGQPLADARAMIPSLDAVDEDTAADAALLAAIADWAERYTPLVALDQDGLMLDMTGCAHLFGGEDAMVADLLARLAAQGFAARAAIAGSPGAASAAARFSRRTVVSPEETPAMLAPLPLAALRLDAETVSALDRVGLKRIGQILEAPAPAARRPLRQHASPPARPGARPRGGGDRPAPPGRRRSSPSAASPSRSPAGGHRRDHRLARREHLPRASRRAAKGRGPTSSPCSGSTARSAASRSAPAGRCARPKLVLDLFREKFAGLAEEIDAGFGFDMVRLSVPVSAPAEPAQVDLAGDAMGEADLGQLIDRIGARLGAERVSRIAHGDSHVPERAEIREEVSEPAAGDGGRRPGAASAHGRLAARHPTA